MKNIDRRGAVARAEAVFPEGSILAPVLDGLFFRCPIIARSDENMQIDAALSNFVFIFSGDLVTCCKVTCRDGRALGSFGWRWVALFRLTDTDVEKL
jgi:hypothetical protein